MAYIVPNAPIPAPTEHLRGGKYPFADLEPGQSFMVPNKADMPPGEDVGNASTVKNMRTIVCRMNAKGGKRFRCRIYPQDKHWVQVWRDQ